METAVDTLNHAFYERTAEQLATHARHTSELVEIMPNASPELLSRQADRRMQREFLTELGRLADVRADTSRVHDADFPQSDADFEVRRENALNVLREEIAELHAVLPFQLQIPETENVPDSASSTADFDDLLEELERPN